MMMKASTAYRALSHLGQPPIRGEERKDRKDIHKTDCQCVAFVCGLVEFYSASFELHVSSADESWGGSRTTLAHGGSGGGRKWKDG